MYAEYFGKSTIGADYLKTNQVYPVDLLLEYLHGLMHQLQCNQGNEVWEAKYSNEIAAVKEILKIQTNGEHA